MISTHSLLLLTIIFLILVCAECQLTFSPDWGKRSEGIGRTGAHLAGAEYLLGSQWEKCKASNEMIFDIFRFIQTEAQTFLNCQRRE